jgi:hypothetical protein
VLFLSFCTLVLFSQVCYTFARINDNVLWEVVDSHVLANVLIVGAAVILWYGNTLNSWVVGGLVGGFGALLLSIPISFILFSYFSQHYHQPQQEETLEDEMLLMQHRSYSIVQDQSAYDDEEYFDENQEFDYGYDEYHEYDQEEIYDGELDADDEYLLAEQRMWEEKLPRRVPPSRYLPFPSSARFSDASQDISLQRQRDYYGADPERQWQQRGKGGSRPTQNARSRGYRTDPSYRQYRSEALRAARMEAALRAEYEENGFSSVRSTRRLEQMQRSGQMIPLQDKSGKSRSPRDITQSSTKSPRRPRRVVDALPPQDRSRRPFSAPDDNDVE